MKPLYNCCECNCTIYDGDIQFTQPIETEDEDLPNHICQLCYKRDESDLMEMY